MQPRFDIRNASPGPYKAMLAFNGEVHASGLDLALMELVKVRVSQINGCAFCIAMHVEAALKHGVSHQRLHLLAAWRETPLYSDAERAALAWAEALTRLPGGDVPDGAWEEVRSRFPEKTIADLTYAVAEINAWNRLMMAARVPPKLEAAARS